jgi:hypothetical protein
MKEIKAPGKLPHEGDDYTIFLAGSIEMGAAENWQEKVKKLLEEYPVTIFNPRRDDWDSSWEQKIENDQFREQVEWELTAQETANMIIMYFDPKTKAPISLLELGLFAHTGKMIVCCPEGFYRKGNVDITCNRYHIDTIEKLDEVVDYVEYNLRSEML